MRTAVCLIVKNEEDCIAEWIIHYANIGFDEAIIYDNGSTDRTAEVIEACGRVLKVRYTPWTPATHDPQLDAYNDCIARFGAEFDWIAFFDIDEMLVSVSGATDFKETLARFDEASAVGICWVMFGSNGREDKGDHLVMEAFTARGPLDLGANRNTKAVVRPSKVNAPCNNPHWFPVEGSRVTLDGQPLEWWSLQEGVVPPGAIVQADWRLHHYYTRGLVKWRARLARGQFGGLVVTDGHRLELDTMDNEDRTALPYAVAVRQAAERLGCALAA